VGGATLVDDEVVSGLDDLDLGGVRHQAAVGLALLPGYHQPVWDLSADVPPRIAPGQSMDPVGHLLQEIRLLPLGEQTQHL
jgi:hypothetical protein